MLLVLTGKIKFAVVDGNMYVDLVEVSALTIRFCTKQTLRFSAN